MAGPAGLGHLLNREGDEVAYSPPSTIIPSPSPGQPTSTSESQRAHKYSNSQSSTSSIASSTTNSNNPQSGLHSRNPSYSTNPSTPPSAHSTTGSFPPHCTFHSNNTDTINNSNDSNNRYYYRSAGMADPVEPRDNRADRAAMGDGNSDDRPQGSEQRLAHRRAIDLTDDDRAESPTDVAMPMMRRAPAGQSRTTSPLSAETGAAAQRGSALNNTNTLPSLRQHIPSVPIVLDDNNSENSNSSDNAVVTSTSAAAPPALPIFGSTTGFNATGAAPIRLDPALIQSAVPRLFPSAAILMQEVDFTKPRVCKFMADCNITRGMPIESINWRKSMSHVFGRNKNCTRSIPDNVWVWMCRKHYQRSRYRNDHEYCIKLAQFVELQVLRLEAWSNHNRDMGSTQNGVVVDWSLAVRRRELDRLRVSGQKRKTPEDQEEEDDERDDDLPSPPLPNETSVVPPWILAQIGSGKSTLEIQEIIARIFNELQDKTLMSFPDIEILPNITGERTRPKKNRAKPGNLATAKKPADAGHDIRQHKRQRSSDEDDLPFQPQQPSYGNRFVAGPSAPGPSNPPFERFSYGSYTTQFPSLHQRSASMNSASYSQFPATTATTSTPGGAAGYAHGYGAYNDPPHAGVGYNGYVAPQPPEPSNGYWTPNYDAQQARLRQMHQRAQAQRQAQQPQAAYPHDGYYPSSSASQGGPPPAGAAKHTRHLSTPVPPTQPLMGSADRTHDAIRGSRYGQPTPAYPAAQNMYGQPGAAAPPNAYGQSADTTPRYQHYNSLPPPGPSAGDNIPRAASSTTTRLPLRGPGPSSSAAPPHDNYDGGYEVYDGYPSLSSRR
ncbi:hypothetical protein VTG60DRAFT_253 [Thermothelomyces hinnuleus]